MWSEQGEGVARKGVAFDEQDVARKETYSAVADADRTACGDGEAVGAVEQGDVDAAPVGRVVVDVGVVRLTQGCGLAEFAQHVAVFHFGQSNDIWQIHEKQRLINTVAFGLEFVAGPMVAALRREIVVEGEAVVAGVEEVFDIPPGGAKKGLPLLRPQGEGRQQEQAYDCCTHCAGYSAVSSGAAGASTTSTRGSSTGSTTSMFSGTGSSTAFFCQGRLWVK